MTKLRTYQTEALTQLEKQLKRGKKAPLLVMPTGAGKTIVFVELSNKLIKEGKKVLILVHRRELVNQACAKLDLVDAKYGVIAPGYEQTLDPLQVASIYTLSRRMHKIDYIPDVIIFDEAHHVAAKTWLEVVNNYSNALRIGVTATPIRLDNKPLGKYFDKLIIGPEIKDLVTDGYLCRHKVYASPTAPDLSKLKLKRGDYIKKDISEIMKNPIIVGNAVDHYIKHLNNKQAVVFCVDVNHAQITLAAFLGKGIKAAMLTGDTPIKERDVVLNKLKNNDINVLISIDVISEGTDLPCVTGAILLRPTNSEALYRQQVGRVLRPEENKTAIVLDHVNNTITHGFVDSVRPWVLEEEDVSDKGRNKELLRVCKKCGYVYSPLEHRSCPECGHELSKKDILEVEGELERIRKEDLLSSSTIKESFKKSIYKSANRKHSDLIKLQEIIRSEKVCLTITEKTGKSMVSIGDNVSFYRGQGNPTSGVCIGYVDRGFTTMKNMEEVVPKIPKMFKDNPVCMWAREENTYEGWRYVFADLIKEGMTIEELAQIRVNLMDYLDKEEVKKKYNNKDYPDYDLYDSLRKYKIDSRIIRKNRWQDYDFNDIKCLHNGRDGYDWYNFIFIMSDDGRYYDRLRLDKHVKSTYKEHLGYHYILCTETGIDILDGNSLYGEDTAKEIRAIRKSNKNQLDKFISQAKKRSFRSGFNQDWVYRNVYASDLITSFKSLLKK